MSYSLTDVNKNDAVFPTSANGVCR